MLRHPAPGCRGRWCRPSTGSSTGALTILAVEPAASGRQRAGEDQLDLRGFAFSTIPLDPGPQRDPQAGVASRATTPAEPES